MSSFFPMLRSNTLFPEERLFRNFFDDFPPKRNSFAMDIRDEGDHFLLEADMPGFNKEDIKVKYHNNVLTIKAEKSSEKEESKENNYLVKERYSCSTSRQVIVEDIVAEEISAVMENGVLKITLPKKAEKALPEGREIEIR